MVRVAEGHASLGVHLDGQLPNSLRGEPELPRERAAAIRPIQQFDQTIGARSGWPASVFGFLGHGLKVAGLAARGGGPELRLAPGEP
jgi:hypothetical protein